MAKSAEERKLEAAENLKRTEFALLGSMILDPACISEVAELVIGADFGEPEGYGRAFDAIVMMHDAGVKFASDPRVLFSEFSRMGVPDRVANHDEIGRLCRNVPNASHAKYYATQVRKASGLRRLAAVGAKLVDCDEDESADPVQLAEWAAGQMALYAPGDSEEVVEAGRVANDILAELQSPKSRPKPLMSGLPPLDVFAGGWHPGELVILAARPSIGKTALALQVAEHNAEQSRPTIVISLEMRDRELVARQLAGRSGVDGRRMRIGDDMRQDELRALGKAADELQGVPLRIWSPSSATLQRIRGIAKHAAATTGLSLLVVDYLSLVRPTDPHRPRHEQVGEIACGLKALAKELSIPVLCLAQLNREAEKESEPLLSHLRESGAIEQDADVVLLLHRADRTAEDATIFVAKHRHGAVGKVSVRFDPIGTRFVERDYSWKS